MLRKFMLAFLALSFFLAYGQKFIDKVEVEGGAELSVVNIMPYREIRLSHAGEKPQETPGVTLTSFAHWPEIYALNRPLNVYLEPLGGLEITVKGMAKGQLATQQTLFDRKRIAALPAHNILVIDKRLIARLEPNPE